MITVQEIGERVMIRRRRLRITQEELAALCGCGAGAIGRLERGKTPIDAVSLAGIAVALGCSADYLLGLKEEERKERPETPKERRRSARTRPREVAA